MGTIVISVEWDYSKLSGISAEEVFNELKNLSAISINDKVFLGLDFLTEIRDLKIIFKKINNKWKKFLLS
jgi:hypothetical protein